MTNEGNSQDDEHPVALVKKNQNNKTNQDLQVKATLVHI